MVVNNTSNPDQYSYPAEPPACIDISQPEAVGQPCEDCPFTPTEETGPADDCRYLAVGRQIISLTAAVDGLSQRNDEMRTDLLVQDSLTPAGLRDELRHNQALGHELARRQWGVIRLDGRFVNYLNTFGNLIGDEFLSASGQAIDEAILHTTRHRNIIPPDGVELRRDANGRAAGPDILCRQGGDEFSIIVRNVDYDELKYVAGRVAEELGVGAALSRYMSGNMPLVASVGIAHASEVEPDNPDADSIDLYDWFKQVNAKADEGQMRDKSRQYEEMWWLVCDYEPQLANDYTATPDGRKIAQLFLERYCPDFYQDPYSFLNLERDN